MIGEALRELADIANCVSGDFHMMHFNVAGEDFDTMHKKVLRKYYEEAADDFDSWAEAACMFDMMIDSPNLSAKRIKWKSFEHTDLLEKSLCVEHSKTLMESYLAAMMLVFDALNKQEDDALSIGVANTLQTRIEYWSKEYAFFNARRSN